MPVVEAMQFLQATAAASWGNIIPAGQRERGDRLCKIFE